MKQPHAHVVPPEVVARDVAERLDGNDGVSDLRALDADGQVTSWRCGWRA
jgi:hypothetical protein